MKKILLAKYQVIFMCVSSFHKLSVYGSKKTFGFLMIMERYTPLREMILKIKKIFLRSINKNKEGPS